MNEKANLTDRLAQFHEYWSPRVIGEMNDCKLQVVKVKGEFVWHTHAETDEFFLVLKGQHNSAARP